MYVNSETLSLLVSGSFIAASHIQTHDCRVIVDISILIKLVCFYYELILLFQNVYPILQLYLCGSVIISHCFSS